MCDWKSGTGFPVPDRLPNRLHGDADRYAGTTGIPAVEQVVAIAVVIDIDIVRLIPVGSPILGIWIHHAEPIAAVLEPRIGADDQEGEVVDVEEVIRPVVAAEIAIRNSVAVVPATLLPAAPLGVPVGCAVLLPYSALLDLLSLLLRLCALLLQIGRR